MFVCHDLRTETWSPDFYSSGQASPVWTRVTSGATLITNSLEWVEWEDNPVQVVLCDACGHVHCASGGYVHVSRLGDFILWSSPQTPEEEPPYVLRTLGALAIPVATWNLWSAGIPDVPHADRLVRANPAAVADAWILGPARTTDSIVRYLREQLVGGDTLEKDAAIALVERALASLGTSEPAFEVVSSAGARLETLYFDGPRDLDWTAFAFAGAETFLALDREHFVRVRDSDA